MKRLGMVTLILLLALVGLANKPELKASEFDQKTVVLIQRPVEVPGGDILRPGTYVFTVLEHFDNRSVVRIFTGDEKTVLSTFIATEAYRLHDTDRPVVTFVEQAAGKPDRIKAWWYPGELIGQGFVY